MWAARRTIDQLIQLERYFVINEEPPNNPLFKYDYENKSLPLPIGTLLSSISDF